MTEEKDKKEKEEEYECVDNKCSFKVRKEFKSPEEKVEDLKQAIKDLGYQVEQKGEEIKISE